MRVLLTFILIFLTLQLPAQNLELIQNQWEALLNAKTNKEKLHRSQTFELLLNPFRNGNNDISQRPWHLGTIDGLSELEGIYEIISDDSTFYLVSWAFPLGEGKYQYSMVSHYIIADSLICGSSKCTNYLGLDCSPRSAKGKCRKANYSDEWKGVVYFDIDKQSEYHYLLKGYHFDNGDTIVVNHNFIYEQGLGYKIQKVDSLPNHTFIAQ